MKLTIQTPIAKNYKSVFARFDLELFKKLKPPAVSLEVERFDGCKKGDQVHLIVSGKKWVSHITDFYQDDNEIYFIDRGVVTPAPIKSWTHIHKIKKTGENECVIIDDIDFSTGNVLMDKLLYPALLAMFSLRRPIYKRELS